MTVLVWYKFILRCKESRLKDMVDRYNKGKLPENLRKALELVDGLPLDD